MPGTSGIISPFIEMDGLYFNNDGEPDEFLVNFTRDIEEVMKSRGVDYIPIEFETKEDYYEVLNYLDDFHRNKFKVYGVMKDAPSVIIKMEPEMIAEHEQDENAEEVSTSEMVEEMESI